MSIHLCLVHGCVPAARATLNRGDSLMWLPKAKIFLSWPFIERHCWHLHWAGCLLTCLNLVSGPFSLCCLCSITGRCHEVVVNNPLSPIAWLGFTGTPPTLCPPPHGQQPGLWASQPPLHTRILALWPWKFYFIPLCPRILIWKLEHNTEVYTWGFNDSVPQ